MEQKNQNQNPTEQKRIIWLTSDILSLGCVVFERYQRGTIPCTHIDAVEVQQVISVVAKIVL